MRTFEPNLESEGLILATEKDIKYNAYTDLRLVANLSDVRDMDDYPPSIIDRAEAIRNLRGKGFDMGLVGLRVTQKTEEGKEILNVVVDGSKSSEYQEFVDEMKEVRKWYLGETTTKPETPVLDRLGINVGKFVEKNIGKEEPGAPTSENEPETDDTDAKRGIYLRRDFLKNLDDEKMNFEVISKAEIEKNYESEYQSPASKLILLGNINRKPGGEYVVNSDLEDEEISNEVRISMLRKLVANGFDVGVIGINLKREGDMLEYFTNLRDVDVSSIVNLVKEIEEQDKNYDDTKFSDEFKRFMGKNLEKFRMTKDLLFRDKVLIAENQTIKSEDDEKTKKKDNLVWYDGILKDLKLATFLDKDLNEGERNKRWEAVDRLRANEGITLPKMSLENDTNETKERYANREKVLGAAEFLWNPDLTTNDFWKTREDAMKFLNDCGIGVNGKPYLLEVKEEKKNKEPIWYEGVVKDLKDATDINSAEEVWKRAIDSLREHKVVFPHDTSTIDGDPGNSLRLKIFFAADFLDGKTNDRWVSKEAALKFLKNNLGVGRGGETIGNKFTIDDKRAKEEYFVGLMEIADPKKWNEMIDILKGLSAVDRDYGFGYLKVAYEWYTDPEKIKAIKGGWNLWKDTFAPILNKLGIKMDGIV
ncbi:hypothetical protein COW83_05170 [Candidatus Collierbacteria bacterium CG22_combo_CG10-13_8_21_14_all_43_12]|uniref:Uncharacterized protein n=1 Tax=Candidatus Collierbacteria bacterium CG22_combo_CG10-13_8_21_14_all_43_12 TaxID=1974537 RepID=A0A2H0DSW0_9BACT|nr:MAG: hypothetical protein COW83_05170 [Candidatus Collierbacteria bacterium CG22_combo_CG10-13_8_21_14_all_43_12]